MITLVAIATPILAAVAMAVLPGPRSRAAALGTAAAVTATTAAVVALRVADGRAPEVTLGSLGPGLELGLRVDAAGALFAVVAGVLWLLAVPYTLGYLRSAGVQHQPRFLVAFAACIGATMGLAYSANLVTFFLFYELLTLATYPLVVHTRSPEALAAGRRYLLTLLAGGSALLVLVVSVEVVAPGGSFTPGGYLDGVVGPVALTAFVVLAVLGVGSKAALMPLHRWLPSAMVAPTPVSALLHAVAVVKAGVFGFVRIFGYVIGPVPMADLGLGVAVGTLAAVTVVTASVIAFRQDQLKRRLAYSTVAHLALMVLGLSLATAAAWEGALLHLLNHAVLKITLFFCAGALYATAKVDRVSQLDGIGRRMPLTMAAFGVASLGLAGVPPVGGFVSKWFLSLGAIEAESPVLAAVVLGSGLLTAGYLLPIVHRAFFRRPPEDVDAAATHGEAPWSMVLPLSATAAVGLLLGIADVTGLGSLAAEAAAAVTGAAP